VLELTARVGKSNYIIDRINDNGEAKTSCPRQQPVNFLCAGFNCVSFEVRVMSTKPRKIVLLGSSGVGKTSIFMRWGSNTFNPNEVSTIGGMNMELEWKCREMTANFVIWDTAGQERFHAITPFYLQGAEWVVIVVAWNDPASFITIPKWVTLVNESICDGPRVQKLLAINKSDLAEDDREKVMEMAEMYKEFFAVIVECSAKTGENISAILSEIAQIVCQREAAAIYQQILLPTPQDNAFDCC
jgi:small GTP-binding protein